MAYKAGAPVVPISIIGSHQIMPTGWMFSMKPARGTARVVVHEPIESKGKTEAELAAAVRESLISGLPEDQKPL
jgi:1-acyl-sn-glycerol-3-phosphate acyltransferase